MAVGIRVRVGRGVEVIVLVAVAVAVTVGVWVSVGNGVFVFSTTTGSETVGWTGVETEHALNKKMIKTKIGIVLSLLIVSS